MATFSIADIRSLMSAVSIAYNKATRREAKEMEKERMLDLMRRGDK